MNKKRVLAITLARGGSKSIYKKNIANLCGKPLIQYTIDEVKKSRYINDYFVSTEDDEIERVSKSLGANVIKRPPQLATDTTSSAESLLHAVNTIVTSPDYDYVVEIMATNPLKTVEDIDGCIEKLETTGADSVVSVVRLYDHHPSRIKYIQNDILQDFYPEVIESRRQDLNPPAYIRNGSIYAMKKDFLLRDKVRYNKFTRPYIMSDDHTINIDERMDLYIAEAIIQNRVLI